MSQERPSPIPVVHSLSQVALEKNGFILIDKGKYWRKKDDTTVTYDGYQWKYGTTPVQFMEELEKLIAQ